MSHRVRFVPWLTLLVALFALPLAIAQESGKGKSGGKEKGQPKLQGSWAVIGIGDDFRVVDTSELPKLKAELAASYKEAVKAWENSRAEAKKDKKKFTEKRPKQEAVKILATGLASREAAEAAREKLAAKAGGGWLVVQNGSELSVVEKKGLAKFEKSLNDAYKKALEKFEADKQAAKKSKQKFTEKRPVAPKVKVVAAGLASEAAAREKLETLRVGKGKPEKSDKGEKKDREGADKKRGGDEGEDDDPDA